MLTKNTIISAQIHKLEEMLLDRGIKYRIGVFGENGEKTGFRLEMDFKFKEQTVDNFLEIEEILEKTQEIVAIRLPLDQI